MRSHAAAVLAISTAAACGGGAKSAESPQSTARPEVGTRTKGGGYQDQGMPAWVNKGSGAYTQDENRAFYGVGAAGGIKNPGLLRSTADNRARAELAKTFETFSASLMKDYMNSTGEQNVEAAVKTFNAMSLKGVQMVDHYIAGDGTLYALARLDLKDAAAALKAEATGLAKSYTEKVKVDDMFDQGATKESPPPPQKAASTETGSTKAPKSAKSGKAPKKGGKPKWVDGQDPKYPYRKWLCAVGYGPKRDMGENAAYAAISRVFIARVASVSRDFMGAYAKTGAESVEVQSSEVLTKTSTDKILSGVSIVEIWKGKDRNFYAYACLERPKAKQVLIERITGLDQNAGEHIEQAKSADKLGKVTKLKKALEALMEREALNGELRIIDPDGIGAAAQYSHVDVSSAFEAAAEALRVGVIAEGPHDSEFYGIVVEGLSDKGYKVSEGDAEGMDVLVEAKIEMEDAGKGTGRRASMSFVRGMIQVKVKNLATNKVLGSFREERREGHRSKSEAERRVVQKLAKKLNKKVGDEIEKKMMR